MDDAALKRTPLFEEHKALGARLVPFAGWEMPVQYSGVIEEHNAVRTKVGLFDVSHMGEIGVSGPNAFDALQWMLSNDLSKLLPGKAQYSVLTNFEGGAVDDVIVYQRDTDDYLICVNASNIEKDFKWMLEQNRYGALIQDLSDEYVQFAIQGPNAQPLMEEIFGFSHSPEIFSPFSHREVHQPFRAILARTGYTGEDGFEIYLSPHEGPEIWRKLLQVGKSYGILPIGLGARDTLRLEAALCLYGHELRDNRDILSSGLGWVTKFQKGDFIGKEKLEIIKKEGPSKKLVGIELIDQGIAREETPIYSVEGNLIGIVTSGTKTPTVNKSIALAYINADYSMLKTEIFCEVRGRKIKAVVVPIPFYKRSR